MNNEELIKHFKGVLTGTSSEQDTANFTQMLIQIAKEGCGERKSNPVYEALETLDDFLEELDEFYGLAALKYGSEAYRAMETLRSWCYKQNGKEEVMNHTINYDEKFDIFRIREVGKGNFDYYAESQDNGYIHEFRDIETNELKGFEIWDFMKHLNCNR